MTALMQAASQGRMEILETLLRCGADPQATDSDVARVGLKRMAQFGGKDCLRDEALGHCALFVAARHGQAAVISRLIQAGADPNRRDFLDETPLIWAAEGGHQEAIAALLLGGARPDSRTLMAALEKKHPECALDLLQAGVSPDQKALVQAADLADARLLEKMLALQPKLKTGKALAPIAYATRTVPAAEAPPGRWPTLLNQSGWFKRVPEPEEKILEAVEVLLRAGAPVNEISSVGPALYVAAQQGLTCLVRRLLEAGADPRLAYRDRTPLEVARLLGHEEIARLLGDDAAVPPQPALPTARTPGTGKELQQPCFPEFPEIPELEAICGSLSSQPDYLRGGREIRLSRPVDLLALQRHWRTQGIYLFHPGDETLLAAIPADHWRVAVALMQTNGANWDLNPSDVVSWLEKLEKKQPFELSNITRDRLEGAFQTPIAEPERLAQSMYQFCPDIVDQGCGSLEVLVQELKKAPATLFLWWD